MSLYIYLIKKLVHISDVAFAPVSLFIFLFILTRFPDARCLHSRSLHYNNRLRDYFHHLLFELLFVLFIVILILTFIVVVVAFVFIVFIFI
jgi:hypothetical protein